MHCYNVSVLDIGLFQFSSQFSVTLVSVLCTPPLVNPIYIPTTFSLENVFIYLFHKFFFSPSDCHFSIVVNNQTLERLEL